MSTRTAERRSSQRRSARIDALLIFPDHTELSCQVQDFCRGGLFLGLRPAVANRIAERLDLGEQSFRLRVQQGRDIRYIGIDIVRLETGGAGAAFHEPVARALATLLELANSANSIELPSSYPLPERRRLFALLQRRTGEELFERMKGFEKSVQDAFDAAIHAARSDQSRGVWIDARIGSQAKFEKLGRTCLRQVAETLDEALATIGSGRAEPVPEQHRDRESLLQRAKGGSAQLSLVEKDEFEDWLAIRVAVSRTETRFSLPLMALRLRCKALGFAELTPHDNPFGPAMLGDAFRRTLESLAIGREAGRLCIEVFEKRVLQRVGPLFEELNELLLEAGVEPKLDVTRYFSKPQKDGPAERPATDERDSARAAAAALQASPISGNSRTGTQTALGEPDDRSLPGNQSAHSERNRPAFAADSPKDRSAEAFRPTGNPASGSIGTRFEADFITAALDRASSSAAASLRVARGLMEILAERRGTGAQEAPAGGLRVSKGRDVLSNAQVFKELEFVQARPQVPREDQIPDHVSLRIRLGERVAGKEGSPVAISTHQDRALDTVDRFFAAILANDALTPTARAQIQSLELPVLKVFLRDPGFFEESEAIPRQVINRIAELGLAGGRTPAAVQDKVNRLVIRIQNEYDDSPSVFEDVLGELNALIERQNLLYRRNVERVAAAAAGQQKIGKARQAVNAALQGRIGGKRVPRAVMTLLNGGWRDLLSLTHIRSGADSSEWQGYLRVIDTLLLRGEDPQAEINLPELLRIIQEGLASVSSQQVPSGHIREALRSFLLARTEADIEWTDVPWQDASSESGGLEMIREVRQRGLQRWLARVQRLETGAWLRLTQEDGQVQLVRLAWSSGNAERMVFVNHQGMKVVELDAMALALEMQARRASVDQSRHEDVVDETLDNMVRGLYEQLNHAAGHDELTGLPVRKTFQRTLSALVGRQGKGQREGVILISLEQFRLVNETLGQDAGDTVLVKIAEMLREFVASPEHCCRYDGDEFMLYVRSDVERSALQASAAISQMQLGGRGQYTLSASTGWVEIPSGLVDAAEIVRCAEQACRSARKRGPGQVARYEIDSTQRSRSDAINRQLARMSAGFSGDQLLLRCQKIIPLKPETRVGIQYAILMSLYDSESNSIPVSEFVRAAEGYQRMQVIDRSVVAVAMDWMGENRTLIESLGGILINLSGHSVNDDKLLEFIFERLTRDDLPLDKICFDLTDAAAISDPEDVADFMHELQEYGCRFSLGDFGTAATYRLLKQLPVNFVRLDGSYVRSLEKDDQDLLMIRSTTELAHYSGREVIAPQVESEAVLAKLKEAGVDYAQGYYIERPRSLSSVTQGG